MEELTCNADRTEELINKVNLQIGHLDTLGMVPLVTSIVVKDVNISQLTYAQVGGHTYRMLS